MPRELVVVSGKGGTGKTAVASSFAALAGGAVLADADVDAANLGLVIGAEGGWDEPFVGGRAPEIHRDLCTDCGECRDRCRFDAIGPDIRIDLTACEGCGLCARVCPEKAIEMLPRTVGRIRVSDSRYGPFVHARLGPGEENCGKLVSRVRELAREEAKKGGFERVIVDGPPGIGCPAIASLTGADFALVVTEPGVAGEHDLSRVVDLAGHFGVRVGVAVNRWDFSPDITERIERWCDEREIPMLARIPFDPLIVAAVVAGRPPVLGDQGPAAVEIEKLWKKVRDLRV